MACGVAASNNMNPVLIKPTSGCVSSLLLKGKLVSRGYEYPGTQRFRARLRAQVLASFEAVKRTCDLVIVEGAGSAAEANLRSYDVSNM